MENAWLNWCALDILESQDIIIEVCHCLLFLNIFLILDGGFIPIRENDPI